MSDDSRQSIGTRKFRVSKLNTIRSAIAGYAGAIAIAKELLQNADDANSSFIDFHICEDALEVRNGSLFSEANFDAICDIASGSKREDEDAIGTWGTGFLSVYQLTDYPILRSAGREVTFDPEADELNEYPSEIVDHTVFRFPWRRATTAIGTHIEGHVWSRDDTAAFLTDLCSSLYSLSPFLRHVERLAVYGETGAPVLKIGWSAAEMVPITREAHLVSRTVTIAASNRLETHCWRVWKGRVPKSFSNGDGKIIKNSEVAFQFGTTDADTFALPHGLLYNYLPTKLETGFQFHIQGDFFPNANRTDVLMESDAKSDWNRSVIDGIGDLVGASLLSLRDACPNRQVFYQLVSSVTNARNDFLKRVPIRFRPLACAAAIIHTELDGYQPGHITNLMEPDALRSLSLGHVPNIPTEPIPSALADFVGIKRFTLVKFLNRTAQLIPANTNINESHAIIGSRDRLDTLLDLVADALRRGESNALVNALQNAPVILFHNQSLYPKYHSVKRIWLLHCGDDEIRSLFAAESFRLIDSAFQARHKYVIDVLKLEWVDVNKVLDWLSTKAATNCGKVISEGPTGLESISNIKRVVRYVSRLYASKSFELNGLPLCVDHLQCLARIGDPVLIASSNVRLSLPTHELCLLHDELHDDPDYISFLRQAKHPELDVNRVVDLMSQWFSTPCFVRDHSTFSRRAPWKRLVEYVSSNRSALSDASIEVLKGVPFIPTAGGRYASAKSGTVNLKFPPRSKAGSDIEFRSLVPVDNLIDSSWLPSAVRGLLGEVLHIEAMSASNFVCDEVLPFYNSPACDHLKREELLRFIRDRLSDLSNSVVITKLRNVPLIRCTDDVYRVANDVYLPTAELDRLLPHGYPKPHKQYAIIRAKRTRNAEVVDRSEYGEFFRRIGFNEKPILRDVVSAIQVTVEHPCNDDRSEYMKVAFYYFDDLAADGTADLTVLAGLRELGWLPSTDGDGRWHRPNDLFPARYRSIAGKTVKYLPFREPRREFARAIGLHADIAVNHVVDNLLQLAASGEPAADDIYRYLGQAIADPQIDRLRNMPVVYDRTRNKYWHPDRVLVGEHRRQLGEYFGYLPRTTPEPVLRLMYELGVATTIDPIRHYVLLLKDITLKHTDKLIDDRNAHLLTNAYCELARCLDTPVAASKVVSEIGHTYCLLAEDMYLYKTGELCINDMHGILAGFREKPPEASLTGKDDRLLFETLGVRKLSDILSRSLYSIEGEESADDLTSKLETIRPYFDRLIEFYAGKYNDGWVDLDDVASLSVVYASKIQVQYTISLSSVNFHSVQIDDAWYDQNSDRLYVTRSSQRKTFRSLAREIAKLLNPSQGDILVSIIRDMFGADNDDGIRDVLDEYDIPGFKYSERSKSFPNMHSADADDQNAFYAILDTDARDPAPENTDVAGGSISVHEKEHAATSDPPATSPIHVSKQPGTVADREYRNQSNPGYRNSSTPSQGFPHSGDGGHIDAPKPGNRPHGSPAQQQKAGYQYDEYQSDREGPKHRRYKEHISQNLHLVDPTLKLYDPTVPVEYPFESYDRVDILACASDGLAVPIEIESHIRPNNLVGAWQAAKYKHLAALLNGCSCDQTRSILVAPEIPNAARLWCQLHGIDACEVPLPSDTPG